MTYKIRITSTAEFELAEAIGYYVKINRKIARLFLKYVKAILEAIQQEPLHYQKIGEGFRQVPVKKFPFIIIYEILS
jgi:mRNA-degrading endonuclease RelE of RelBE toxin-antitoxin system